MTKLPKEVRDAAVKLREAQQAENATIGQGYPRRAPAIIATLEARHKLVMAVLTALEAEGKEPQ